MIDFSMAFKNKLFWAASLLLAPVFLQVFYTGFSFFDFDNHKWLTYKGYRLSLMLCWYLIIIGLVHLFRIKLSYLAAPIFISLSVFMYSLLTREDVEYEVFAAIANTTTSEAVEFFSTYLFIVPLLFSLIIFSIIYLLILNTKEQNFRSKKMAILLLILGLLGLSSSYVFSRDTLYKTYPLSIPFYAKNYYKEIVVFKKNFNNINYTFQGVIDSSEDLNTCLLVIGETARQQSMSIYGYERDTTPNMQEAIANNQLKAARYKATSAGVSTRLSVPLLLSTANSDDFSNLAKQPTLRHIFNEVDIQTALLSNQEIAGRNNDIIALILNGMNDLTYLSESDVTRGYDIDLVPHIEDAFQKQTSSMFLVLHLMGSHWKYDHRYPDSFSYFNEGDYRVDTYDNSIRYTDHVLGEIIKVMEKSNRPLCLVYTSDHGENLNDVGDGNYLHAIKEMTEYEVKVPFVFVSNQAFYNRNKDKVDRMLSQQSSLVSHDNISHTLLGLMGVYDQNAYKESYDLSSASFQTSTRSSINRRGETIDVDHYLEPK